MEEELEIIFFFSDVFVKKGEVKYESKILEFKLEGLKFDLF